MSDYKERIYKLEGTERFGMSSFSLTIRNFELDSKFQMCESDSHIQQSTSKFMEVL